MVKIEIEYEGGLHCTARHGPSRAALTTDAPVGHIADERTFRLEEEVAMFLGPDEGFDADLGSTSRRTASRDRRPWLRWDSTMVRLTVTQEVLRVLTRRALTQQALQILPPPEH